MALTWDNLSFENPQPQYNTPAVAPGLNPAKRGVPTRGMKNRKRAPVPNTVGTPSPTPHVPYVSERQPIIQAQPYPTPQRQLPGPPPNPASFPAHGRHNFARGLMPDAPYAAMDTIPGPGRDSERIAQQQSATPLNAELAQLVYVQPIGTPKHAHRIRTSLYKDYPQYDWRTDRKAFLSPNAYTSRRDRIKGYAPVQYQLTPGGMIIAGYQNNQQNINTNLAQLYHKAKSPVSSNFSGNCK